MDKKIQDLLKISINKINNYFEQSKQAGTIIESLDSFSNETYLLKFARHTGHLSR